jgi:hypothetical protein
MIERHRGPLRALLIALGAPQMLTGVWALLAPHSFYSDFPAGGSSGWVSRLGPYDEHLVRDVGGLFIGLGVLMLLAALWLGRELVRAAAVTWLLFSAPHLIFHVLNLEPYRTADAIASMVTIALTVLGGLLVLALAWRSG